MAYFSKFSPIGRWNLPELHANLKFFECKNADKKIKKGIVRGYRRMQLNV